MQIIPGYFKEEPLDSNYFEILSQQKSQKKPTIQNRFS